MHQKIQHELAILRCPQVQKRTGLSRSTLYQYIRDGGFPKPVQLGLRAVGWLESDISDWIATRVKDYRACNASAAHGDYDAKRADCGDISVDMQCFNATSRTCPSQLPRLHENCD